jgi:hypothetical protein
MAQSAVLTVTVAVLAVVFGFADALSVKLRLPVPLVTDGASQDWLLVITQSVFEVIVIRAEVTAADPGFHAECDTVSDCTGALHAPCCATLI